VETAQRWGFVRAGRRSISSREPQHQQPGAAGGALSVWKSCGGPDVFCAVLDLPLELLQLLHDAHLPRPVQYPSGRPPL